VFDLVEWLDGPPAERWNGVLFANEVIDALPTPRFCIRQGEVYEEHVALDGEGRFVRSDRPADPLLSAAVRHVERYLGVELAEGYRSELLPQLPYWIQAVMGGWTAARCCSSTTAIRAASTTSRSATTAPARVLPPPTHNDLYRWPGLQDLTASVDFTALAEAGTQAGSNFPATAPRPPSCWATDCRSAWQRPRRAWTKRAPCACRNEAKQLTLPSAMGDVSR
jgi:SAM-dependent MidA family methyltransferase